MHKAAQAYLQTQVTTTNQGDLVILLFDGCIKFIHQAKEYMAAKDYAQKGILISKALDVLGELQSSLNAQKGGELAENLRKIYLLCQTKLLAANMNMDQALLDEVTGILTGIRDAFAQINTPEFIPRQAPPASRTAVSPPMAPQAENAPGPPPATRRVLAAYGQARRTVG